ncbi:MAG: hypothetical protein ACKVQC_01385, partial [Elusimicrobiota bacterium]
MKLSLKKSLALFLSLIYFLNQGVFASLAESRFWEERRLASMSAALKPNPLLTNLPAINNHLEVASKWSDSKEIKKWPKPHQDALAAISLRHGSIQDIYSTSSPQPVSPVVLIQDIHLNAEAQENIASLLNGLIEKKQAGLVGVEGAFDTFDFKPFKKFSHHPLAKEITDAFLKAQLLAAPSYVGIINPTETSLFMGIDDKEHYDLNVKAYLETRTLKKKVIKEIEQEKHVLEEKKKTIFSKELAEFDAKRESYERGTLGLGEYVDILFNDPSPLPLYG